MKTKLLLLSLCLSAFMLYSCNDDDNNPNPNNTAVEAAFNAKYPNAGGVDWERKFDYYVVDFWWDGMETEAWFDGNGEWYMTETELTFEQLPNPIKEAFRQSEYSTWRIDDVDMLERKGMEIVYVLEVEQGKQEFDLYYSADGTLVKAVPDSNNGSNHYLPTNLPEKISAYISTNHPTAKIIEVEKEYEYYEVDIIEGNLHKELAFSLAGEWVYTKREDFRQADVPQNVLAAITQNPIYNDYKIDDIDYYETPAGNFYMFELEKGSAEIKVKVSIDGAVIS